MGFRIKEMSLRHLQFERGMDAVGITMLGVWRSAVTDMWSINRALSKQIIYVEPLVNNCSTALDLIDVHFCSMNGRIWRTTLAYTSDTVLFLWLQISLQKSLMQANLARVINNTLKGFSGAHGPQRATRPPHLVSNRTSKKHLRASCEVRSIGGTRDKSQSDPLPRLDFSPPLWRIRFGMVKEVL